MGKNSTTKKTGPLKTEGVHRLHLSVAQRAKFRSLWRLEDMQALGENGREFELFVGYLFEQEGFKVWTTPSSGDGGIDLIVVKNGVKAVAQCKQYASAVKVPSEKVYQLLGSMRHSGASRAFMVTTSSVTERGKSWAAREPIRFIEGPALLRWAARHNRVIHNQPRPGWRAEVALACQTLRDYFTHNWRAMVGLISILIACLIVVAYAALSAPSNAEALPDKTLPVGAQKNQTVSASPSPATATPPPTISAGLATLPGEPSPTPAERVKDAVSAPCYMGQVKGNTSSHFYHEPGWHYYNSFGPNAPNITCFDNAATAQAAGYRPGAPPDTPRPKK